MSNAWAHSWDDGVVQTPATEDHPGVIVYTCTECGTTERKTVPQLLALTQYEEEGGTAPVVEPTVYTATFAHDAHATIDVYYTQDYTAPDETAVSSAIARNSATGEIDGTGDGQINFIVRVEDGYELDAITIEGSYKNLKDLSETEGISNLYRITKVAGDLTVTVTTKESTHIHTEGAAVKENETAPDCTDDGSYDEVIYCAACGEELSRHTVTVPATGHTAGNAVKENETAATCTENGSYDEAVYCTVCGEELDRETITISATGHTWGEWTVVKQPTVLEEGLAERVCTNDPSHTETKPIEKLSVSFIDVPADTFYTDAVDWAVANGVTTGTSATTFSPDGVCTRAQIVTFLWRVSGCPEMNSESVPFVDVATNSYYYKAVAWAVANGITKGTSATTFSPDAVCTRAQAVTFLYRYAGSSTGANLPFADVASDAYYADAVSWAVSVGVTKGTSATTFSPDAICTRAQIVTFLYRSTIN